MNRDDIIRMAREAEQYATTFCNGIGDSEQHHWFDAYNERFAALVAAEEREACAKVCDDLAEGEPAYDNAAIAAHVIRKRARARGGE